MSGKNLFDKHRRAIELGGTLYLSSIEAGRGYEDGETIPIPDEDWSDESLEAVVAVGPGHPVLTTLSVSITTEQRTWAYYRDVECIPKNLFPCGIDFEETITVSLLTVSWSAANLQGLPLPDTKGEPTNLYMEIRRRDGTGPRFAAADFILTESVK